ncbi:MAG: thioredoxin family protein [Candidatus Marinimicrobia bacterium]|nr:thioredoxin family protein [Candidatus Neomarinimicrobiota bacterium]MCF7904668.1 thioredoxin family protein [Candidatus Neomarinimicrobiota bacterium]
MRLEAETWTDPDLIAYAKEHFIAYHLNVDSTESNELKKRFNIRGIPSFVFVDEEGNEVDRIIGFMPPEEYLAEMKRIREGINTIPDLMSRLDEDPENVDLIKTLAEKVEAMGGLKASVSYWEMIFEMDEVDETSRALASLKMALFLSQEKEDPEMLISFIGSATNTEVLPEAHRALKDFYRKQGNKKAEAEAYRRYVDFMSGLKKETPSLLNGYAWRMTQLGMNLENALQRIDQAIGMFDEDYDNRARAQIMDTKGEVLWKLDRIDEAVAVMDACIALQPDDNYYKEQKGKFLGKDAETPEA